MQLIKYGQRAAYFRNVQNEFLLLSAICGYLNHDNRVGSFIPYYDLFYVISRYVFSKWRSIRPVEINQYDITMTTHCDITMCNDIAKDAHCEITMGNDAARDINCDVTMINGTVMCIYHGITIAV